MKIDLLLIGPNIKYNHGPSKSFELMINGLIKNGYKIKYISGYNLSIFNIIYIFFTKKIYIVSFPELILFLFVYIFFNKKFIVGSDIEFKYRKISSLIYKKNNVLKIFNSYEKKYYLKKYKYGIGNMPFLLGHGVKIDKNSYNNKNNDYIIYYKCNNKKFSKKLENLKNNIINFLKTKKVKYEYIEYGKYKYEDWINLLKNSKKVIFITTTETYGIAKIEALSYNLPILNFKFSKTYIKGKKIKYGSTFSIFENGFGEEFKNYSDFKNKFNTINLKKYSPKKIIKNKYCYIKKSKELLKLFNNIK